jgi:hypothetical protein
MSVPGSGTNRFLCEIRSQHDAMFERIAADLHKAFVAQTRIIVAAMWIAFILHAAITIAAFRFL